MGKEGTRLENTPETTEKGKPLSGFFERYDTLLVLDTETSGLRCAADEIIELSAAVLRRGADGPDVTREYDELVRLPAGKRLDYRITQLTGITAEDLASDGIPARQACADFQSFFGGKTLVAAYNAHFDLSFLYYFLDRDGCTDCLRDADFLDILSVYRDRREYPHRLSNAIEAYGLQDRVRNTHRAVDDVRAALEVMRAMEAEKDDLLNYVNLFGYNPKFGVDGKRIRSVRYAPQPYGANRPLYETAG